MRESVAGRVASAAGQVREAGLGRVARAGLGGAAAYLLAMWADEVVLREPTDDLVLLGGLASPHPVGSRLLGLVIHLSNGVLVALVYAATARRWARGPAWSRGVLFATTENTLLWPLVVLLDRFHPWIRRGRLARYNRGVAWVQAVSRHVAFGAVMGALLGLPTEAATTSDGRVPRTATSSSSQSTSAPLGAA